MRISLIWICFCFIFTTLDLQSLADHFHYTSESCVRQCMNDNDCDGQLFCGKNGRCTDDPDVGTHICKKGGGHGDDDKDGDDGGGDDDEDGGGDDDKDGAGDDDKDGGGDDDKDGGGGDDDKDGGDDDDDDDGEDSGGKDDSQSSGGGDGNSSCGGSCKTENDCKGKLICIHHSCGDDSDLGTHICSAAGGGGAGGKSSGSSSHQSKQQPPSGGGSCQASGKLQCGSKSYPQFSCSPPIQAYTEATLTYNDFSEGGDGGSESECDSHYHSNSELIVALSTGWYNHGTRCGLSIIIKSKKTGMSVKAKVVDECDSRHGCDHEHAGQPPCNNNIVDAPKAVWNALHLDTKTGREPILWAMA